MIKYINKYAVLTLTIWIASLLEGNLVNYVKSTYKVGPFKSTAVMMTLSVVIFLIMLGIAGEIIEGVSRKYVRLSKSLGPTRRSGLVVGYLVAVLILYLFFLKLYYQIRLQDLF